MPAALAAQVCGVTPGVTATGALVSYDVADGTSGTAVGGDAALKAGPVVVGAGYRRVLLDGDAAEPDVVRGVVAVPIGQVMGLGACATGHVGGTLFSLEDDSGGIIAGGFGVTIATSARGPIQPFISVRGLAAQAGGTVLDVDVDASGLAVGIEAGAVAAVGRLVLRVAGSLDGFDDGLGVTPYPNQSVEVGLGFRF